MAQDLNRVTLVGRLTRDAELKYTNSGLAVAKLSIAVNRRKRSGDNWTDEVSYFDITLWGKVAESLNQYLQKGKQIAVDGETPPKQVGARRTD
jgi:single-strand DNA-binding protein